MTYGDILLLLLYIISLLVYLFVARISYASAGRDFVFAAGQLSAIHMSLAMLPTSRNSLFLYVCGIPFERALKWHRIMGTIAALSMYTHAVTMILKYASQLQTLSGAAPTLEGQGNIYGTAAGIVFAPMMLLAIDPIRRRFFNAFYYSHQLFLIGTVLAWIHSRTALYLGVGPMLLHLIDRGVRCWRGEQPVTVLSAEVLQSENGAKITKLRLHAPHIHPRAGDYVFLCIPTISDFEYHPFSVSSDPTCTDGIVEFHILRGGVGTFTANVENWAVNEAKCLTDETDAVKLDGPYGQISLPRWRTNYSALVFVCGGVGCETWLVLQRRIVVVVDDRGQCL